MAKYLMTPEEEQLAAQQGAQSMLYGSEPTLQPVVPPGPAPSSPGMGESMRPAWADTLVYEAPTRQQQIEQRIMNASNILMGNPNGVVDPAAQAWSQRMEVAKMQQYGKQLDLQNAQLNRTTQTDDIKEYEFAVQKGYQGTFEQWMKQKTDRMSAPNSFIQTKNEFERTLGRPLNVDEMYKVLYSPRITQFGDVPIRQGWDGGQPLVGGYGGGGGSAMQGGSGGYPSPQEGYPSPQEGPAGGPPSAPTAGVPGSIVGQQGMIDDARANLEGAKDREKFWADSTYKLQEQAVNLPRLDDQIGRMEDILKSIADRTMDGAGFPIGRWGSTWDPETAMAEAEGNVLALEDLQRYKLVPVSDADLAILKSQYPNAMLNPGVNEKIINRALKIMKSARGELYNKMEYVYGEGNGSLKGYDRAVYQRMKRKDDEQKTDAGLVNRWNQ